MELVHRVSGAKALTKVSISIFLTVLAARLLPAQDATSLSAKSSPPRIELQPVLIPDSVVRVQWPDTLKLINPPRGISLLNPGECVRIGIYSIGDNRDEYLEKTKLSFRVKFGGRSDSYPLAPLSGLKQVKPEGLDFVTGALAAGGVKMPEKMKTTASLGISAERWCAPLDATDGTATVEADAESSGVHQGLDPSTLQVETFDTGSKKVFKDSGEVGAFIQTYYQRPNPARLVPAMRFVLSEQSQNPRPGQMEIVAAFLSAAISSDPIAAQDFRSRIAGEAPMSRALGLLVLHTAGQDISGLLSAMSDDDRTKFSSLSPLGDPFDLAPTQQLFQHMDMLWAVFGATGQLKPVQTVAGMLGWRVDYEDFDRLRKTQNHPSTLTPSIVRGVTYTAAGWSLSSFQRNDPLVADYVEFLLASPDTPASIKSELDELATNPAFKRPGGQ